MPRASNKWSTETSFYLSLEITTNLEQEETFEHRSPYLVLGRVLCDPPQPGLHDVVAVQKLLLRPRLGPDLVLGVGRQEVQGRNVQPELPGLSEFSETGPK